MKKGLRRTALASLVALVLSALALVLPGLSPAKAYPLGQGYWMVLDDGSVAAFGDAQFYGSMGGTKLNSPIVGMAPYPFLEGYWLVAADGGIFSYGGAKFHGSLGSLKLNAPIVGITSTPTGRGYWLVASDGGIFAFGDAGFYGSMGGKPLNKPIVTMASTPSGKGYWLTASDGGVFAFGDALFQGSTGGIRLVRPVVGMAPTASGKGYYMVASDGGIFAFGDAVFRGSMGGKLLASPITAMALSTSGNGYALVARDGGMFNYGDAPFLGSLAGVPKPAPVRSIAMRPRLAVEVAPFADSEISVSRWLLDGATNNTTLRLIYLQGEQPAGARIAGVEGLDVAQLGTISYRKVSGGCLQFVLHYDAGAGAGVQRRDFNCPLDYDGTVAVPSFTPSSIVAGNAKVLALQVWYAASIFQPGGGPAEVDDITVAGVTVPAGGVYRLP